MIRRVIYVSVGYCIINTGLSFRESSFNMTRGDENIEGGRLEKVLDTRKGRSEKIRGGAPKIFVYFKTDSRGGGLLKN